MRRMGRIGLALTLLVCSFGCGDDTGLEDYYPELPPTGGAVVASAGEVTDASQLIPGPAQSGLIGDFYIKNDKVAFIVQAPTRVIGVVPQGGNIVDAALIDAAGQPVQLDHFGELSLVYLVGRTCEHDRIEVVRDGKKGGAAVLRAIGRSGINDFINLKGVGALPISASIDPDIEDNVDCATTYILHPGATSMEVHFSLYNGGKDEIAGPMGTLADSGGEVEVWSNTRGFERAGIDSLTTLGNPSPSDYVVYQGRGVAYGLIPRHATPTVNSHVLIAGVSIFLSGNSYLLEVLQLDKAYLRMPPKKGVRKHYDVAVGYNAADIDIVWRNDTPRTISGRVEWSGGGGAVGARVGIFADTNGNGALDPAGQDLDFDFIPDDHAVAYIDVNPDGTFAGPVPATGNLLVRAEVKNQGRSQVVPLADTVNLTIPSPIKVDYQIVDADTSLPIPGRLIALGTHPAFPDQRLFEVYDRASGIVDQVHAIRGTTVDLGDGADPALYLPAGGTYRIYVSRGTEWSVASHPVTGSSNVDLTFALKHVVPTPGYLATDWHVHQVGSPDSPVLDDDRLRTAVSAGVEVFAATDHDYVSDLQPLVVQMGLASLLRVMPGIEVTPFVYGHFNAWPITPDPTTANRGAVDWARGQAGYAMLPFEIFAAMRERGAQMIQVNHARAKGLGEFQAAFSRANVKYDYDNRTVYGDFANASTPNDWLRLPENTSLWSDQFNALEIWNGFTIADSNGDGLRENKSLDRDMRDWLALLSLGFYATPTGNSDSHTYVNDPLGMPRTYVRVPDDSPAALASGAAVDAVLATQTGANATPRDVVITNGPFIDVRVNNVPVLGRAVSSVNQPVTLTVTIASPDWAEFDTLEVFANSTPGPIPSSDNTTLIPLKCWTTRNLASLHAMDPCSQAALSAEALAVDLASVSGTGNHRRYQTTLQITLDASDIGTRAGATGRDAWLVFRARGDRGIFPLLTNDVVSDSTMPVLLGGDMTAIAGALQSLGVPATAVTAPVFVDFDGGGYRAPFAP
jgi:hypothetical protein